MFKKSLFIFRRDLRLNDNTALIEALINSQAVIPCFIFDPRQNYKNPYKSNRAFQFMIESLIDLISQLERKNSFLQIFEGLPHDVIDLIIRQEKIEAVYCNVDYTPFSQIRDQKIKSVCLKHQVNFIQTHDALLNEPDSIRKNDGGIYSIYTPYMRNALSREINRPTPNRFKNYHSIKLQGIPQVNIQKHLNTSMKNKIRGGRQQAKKIISKIDSYKNYDQTRNIPSLDSSTHLSAHNKFGTCSIREIYFAVCRALGPDHTLIKELVWRDFFTQIGYHYPKVLGNTFKNKFNKIVWDNDKKIFKAWCEGLTGFPIVDAGMRELNQTGFMHNRVRMITASFLIKDLHIDWQWGEKYFSQQLIDYDPLVNNGNWQWAASTGCDAQPYFRIFNPWLQQEKYDPDCVYIKKWLPELKNFSPKDIHRIFKKPLENTSYPAPIINHQLESKRTLNIYKSCL